MLHGVRRHGGSMGFSSKAADGKSVVPVGDTCWTPPTAPPTPMGVPTPYPNTCSADKITNGTRTVMIKKKTVGMEEKSYFSTSTGDEPATKALQKGLITHKEEGKCYFKMWSMNVKFEGAGVPRHMDIVTHNEDSNSMTNTPPMVYMASIDVSMPGECATEADKINRACKPAPGETWRETHCGCLGTEADGKTPLKLNNAQKAEAASKKAKADKCLNAQKCRLVPYNKCGTDEGCCSNQTGHHVMPDAMYRDPVKGGVLKQAWVAAGKALAKLKRNNLPVEEDWPNYDVNKAPTLCAEGEGRYGSHGKLHGNLEGLLKDNLGQRHMPYTDARDLAVESIRMDNEHCSEECLKAQLDTYYKNTSNKELKDAKVQPHSGKSNGGYKVSEPAKNDLGNLLEME